MKGDMTNEELEERLNRLTLYVPAPNAVYAESQIRSGKVYRSIDACEAELNRVEGKPKVGWLIWEVNVRELR